MIDNTNDGSYAAADLADAAVMSNAWARTRPADAPLAR